MGEWAQLIASIGILITAITGLLVSLRNSKKLEIIHQATNGLVEKMGAAREAKGLLEGQREGSDSAK